MYNLIINSLSLFLIIFLLLIGFVDISIYKKIHKKFYDYALNTIGDTYIYTNKKKYIKLWIIPSNKNKYIRSYIKEFHENKHTFDLDIFSKILLNVKVSILFFMEFLKEELANIGGVFLLLSLLLGGIVKSSKIDNFAVNNLILNNIINVVVFFGIFLYFVRILLTYQDNSKLDNIFKMLSLNKKEYKEIYYLIYKNNFSNDLTCIIRIIMFIFLGCLFLSIFTYNSLLGIINK